MDVHRSRFVPYPASAINALAFSQPSQSRKSKRIDKNVRLAVGRANGDIEIWNPAKGDWVQETTFYGGRDRSVEGLAWSQEPDEVDEEGQSSPGALRLFSIGYSSSVTEWDLVTGLPLRHSSGNTSEVWCLAAQPSFKQDKEAKCGNQADNSDSGISKRQSLVAGCADGAIMVLSTADNDLQFQRYLSRPAKRQARCLCLAFQNHNTVVAGFADSRVRVYDFRSGRSVRDIAVGASPDGAPKDILVWAIQCLPNGDIVTGDSSGEVRIFDGQHYSQLQRLSGGHEADVLALAASHDGQTVFSTGVDRRTVAYQLQQHPEFPRRTLWAEISHQRHHSHDVKALAAFEGKGISILVSGGADTELNILPIRKFGDENSRTISGLPQHPPVASSQSGRLIVGWWGRELWIWKFPRKSRHSGEPRLLTKMSIKGEENITSATISCDGRVLAVATMAAVKLFHARLKGIQTAQTLRIRKLASPKALENRGARLMEISPDGKWLTFVCENSEVQICRIVSNLDSDDQPRILHNMADLLRLPEKKEKRDKRLFISSSGNYLRTITRIAFSPDSRLLVAGDISGRIESWILSGQEDATEPEIDVDVDVSSTSGEEDERENKTTLHGQHWVQNPLAQMVPNVESAPLLLTFRPRVAGKCLEPNVSPSQPHDMPDDEYHLVVVTAKHQLYEFNLLTGRMTDWSDRNTPSLPADFKALRDRVMGCAWHVASQWQRLWLYGSAWVFMLDMSRDFENKEDQAVANAELQKRKKRKRGDEDARAQKQLNTTGAGSKKTDAEATSLKRRARKLVNEGSESKWKRMDLALQSDDEMDIDDEAVPLRPVRSNFDDAEDEKEAKAIEQGPTKWWQTFKYRPILGLVPLSRDVEARSETKEALSPADEALEVVLIERPKWDLGLPPPFRGIHERD